MAQTTATITAPSVDPRIDRVVIDDTTGVVSVITGAEAASPVPPALTAGKLPVAQVALVVSQTAIVNADLTDERAWPLQVAGEFPAGGTVRMLFEMTTPPTGWTKETAGAYDNNAIRIVTGTIGSGGADNFATVFGSSVNTGSHTLTEAELASHAGHVTSHPQTTVANDTMSDPTQSVEQGISIANKGSDTGHNHTMTMDLKYHDVVVASKD